MTNRRWGNPRPIAAQHCPKAQSCVHEDEKPDKLQKGWVFTAGT